MVAISTFVIFDLESTGLPRQERNRTKITELTFIAVHRQDIEKTPYGEIPLINKLSFLFNPQRNIQAEVVTLTGLSNAILRNQEIFKNRIHTLNSFLDGLPKPVCLVAHNGNSFDFKLLRSEYADANAALPHDLLCVDSLWGFKKILKETDLCHKKLQIAVNTSRSDEELLTDDDDDEWPELNTTAEEWEEIDKLDELFSNMTPNTERRNEKKAKKTALIKGLFEKKTDNTSCKLQDLYKRLLNKEVVNAHRSEADCLMLLECMVALKEHFIPYADSKCKLLSEVMPFSRY